MFVYSPPVNKIYFFTPWAVKGHQELELNMIAEVTTAGATIDLQINIECLGLNSVSLK